MYITMFLFIIYISPNVFLTEWQIPVKMTTHDDIPPWKSRAYCDSTLNSLTYKLFGPCLSVSLPQALPSMEVFGIMLFKFINNCFVKE